MDTLLSFSDALGADYSGQWTDASTLVVTAIDVAGAGPPRVNATSGTQITVSGELRNAPRTSRTVTGAMVTLGEVSPNPTPTPNPTPNPNPNPDPNPTPNPNP